MAEQGEAAATAAMTSPFLYSAWVPEPSGSGLVNMTE